MSDAPVIARRRSGLLSTPVEIWALRSSAGLRVLERTRGLANLALSQRGHEIHGCDRTLSARPWGLEGFTVLSTTLEADDRVDVLIEMKAGAGVCPGCAGVSTRVHERTDVRFRGSDVSSPNAIGPCSARSTLRHRWLKHETGQG